jgi:hypothetical protein
MRTELQENTLNPRFHRTLERRLSTIGRLSELPKLLASEMILLLCTRTLTPSGLILAVGKTTS